MSLRHANTNERAVIVVTTTESRQLLRNYLICNKMYRDQLKYTCIYLKLLKIYIFRRIYCNKILRTRQIHSPTNFINTLFIIQTCRPYLIDIGHELNVHKCVKYCITLLWIHVTQTFLFATTRNFFENYAYLYRFVTRIKLVVILNQWDKLLNNRAIDTNKLC